MKKIAAVFLSLVLLLSMCVSAMATVNIPATIDELGIDLNFPTVDMSGAQFLEVSNVKVETAETGLIVTGEFSQKPDLAHIYSPRLDEHIFLFWNEEKQAFTSDKPLEADDLEISFDGSERDEHDNIITSFQLSLDVATMAFKYAQYENQTMVYYKWDNGQVGYNDKTAGISATMNPDTGEFSYSNSKAYCWKDKQGMGYQSFETGASLWISKLYSTYSIPTSENESMYVEFMPDGKLSSYRLSTVDENGMTLSYSYHSNGQLKRVNYSGETEDGYIDYYWSNGQWYDYNTDQTIDLDIKVNEAAGPYPAP